MKIVLDVNVWISGLLWRGAPGQIFSLAEEQKIVILISEPILTDIEEVLNRPKLLPKVQALGKTVPDLLRVVGRLARSCSYDAVIVPQLRDPDDAVILGTASSATANIIVTGDQDLLILSEFEGIPILTPVDFLSYMKYPYSP
jgi:uncharacterized protein